MFLCQRFTLSRTSSGVELRLALGGGSILQLDCGQTGWENMGDDNTVDLHDCILDCQEACFLE